MTEITTQDQAQGIVNSILSKEAEANKHKLAAKQLIEEADAERDILLGAMKGLGLKTLKHENGLRVTVTNGAKKTKLIDEEALIEDLKAKKLVNFIEKVPAQQRVNLTLFKTYIKTSAWKPGDFAGLEIVQEPDHVTIEKAK